MDGSKRRRLDSAPAFASNRIDVVASVTVFIQPHFTRFLESFRFLIFIQPHLTRFLESFRFLAVCGLCDTAERGASSCFLCVVVCGRLSPGLGGFTAVRLLFLRASACARGFHLRVCWSPYPRAAPFLAMILLVFHERNQVAWWSKSCHVPRSMVRLHQADTATLLEAWRSYIEGPERMREV